MKCSRRSNSSRRIDDIDAQRDALFHRICLKCRYDLRGLAAGEEPDVLRRCPECGEAFDPATVFVRVEPSRWEWVAVAIQILCAVFLLFMAAVIWRTGHHILLVVMAIGVALWSARRVISSIGDHLSSFRCDVGVYLVLDRHGIRCLRARSKTKLFRWDRVQSFRITRVREGLWRIVLKPWMFNFDLGLSVRIRATEQQAVCLRQEIRRRIAAAREMNQ